MLARQPYRTEILDAAAMRNFVAQWEDLQTRCLDDNVYYSPKYALALLDTVERRDVRFISIWQGELLMALLPFTLARIAIPGAMPAGSAWKTVFTFSCMPLVDRTDPARTAAGLVAAMRKLRGGDWTIPQMNVDGPTFKALSEALSSQGLAWQIHFPFERALLCAGKDFDRHMDDYIGSKRRKDLARNRRRLEQNGAVTYESHTHGEGLDRAVQAFLEIEASGWKGERGTALDCHADTRDFALRAFRSEVPGPCRADMLLLDGKPVAIGMMVMSGDTAFTVKGAYDEAYGQYSVGLLLEIEVLRSFLAGPWVGRIDSATAGKHVIDLFWPDRQRVGTLAFSFARFLPRQRLSLMQTRGRLERHARATIKRYLGMD